MNHPGEPALRDARDLLACTLNATDGVVGRIADFYLDDELWVIRYLIIDTDAALTRRRVLILPAVLGHPDWLSGTIPVTITRERILAGPDIDAARPIDAHLLSGNVLMRYYIHATDGDAGHLEGYILDDRSWAIRYLIVQTSNWWPGNQVLVEPGSIERVSWSECMISLDIDRRSVREAPPYTGAVIIGSIPVPFPPSSKDQHAV